MGLNSVLLLTNSPYFPHLHYLDHLYPAPSSLPSFLLHHQSHFIYFETFLPSVTSVQGYTSASFFLQQKPSSCDPGGLKPDVEFLLQGPVKSSQPVAEPRNTGLIL